MKKTTKILGYLLILCLMTTFVVTGAKAEENRQVIQLIDLSNPTGGIIGWNSLSGYDYLYFGKWQNGNDSQFYPLKWRVLDTETNSADGNGLFLLSEHLLCNASVQGGISFNQDYSQYWQGSDAQAWCKDFSGESGALVTDAFSTKELSAILPTYKDDLYYSAGDEDWQKFLDSEHILNGDRVFFLSAEEAMNPSYGFTDDAARKAPGIEPGTWWLRSPFAPISYSAGIVRTNGSILYDHVITKRAVRPAFNLDLSSVLLVSSAKDSKYSLNGHLSMVPTTNTKEWKLTLLDHNRSFIVEEQLLTAKAGDTISLSYDGAIASANEYISAILTNKNGVHYYGRIIQPTTCSGTVSVILPTDLAEGRYTLKVFNEQCNGDYQTDYASAFCDVHLTICNTVPMLAITSPTTDQIITCAEDDFITLSIEANHAASFQWYVKYNHDSAWYPCGISSPDFTLPSVSLEDNGHQYKCTVTNLSGHNIDSPVFTLEVQKKILIPQTSDHFHPGFWIIMCLISCTGCFVSFVYGKKIRTN